MSSSLIAADDELALEMKEGLEQHRVEDQFKEDEEENRFLKELHDTAWNFYAFQRDLYPYPQGDYWSPVRELNFDSFDKSGGAIIQARDLRDTKHYSLLDLTRITNSFDENNVIRRLPSKRLFHGEIDQKSVLVKTWDLKFPVRDSAEFGPWRISDELRRLRSRGIKNHPNIVRLVGYHCDRRLAIIYEGTRPNHFLFDIIESDDFGWEERLKVALQIASVVKAFHDEGFVHGGVYGDCFMIYEDYLVMSYDFNVDYFNRYFRAFYRHYLFDADSSDPSERGEWSFMSRSEEVFAYGFLLWKLFSKRTSPTEFPYEWSFNELSMDLFHDSFQVREEIKSEIMKLVNNCLKIKPDDVHLQPTMGDVVEVLKKLQNPVPAFKKQKLCPPEII